MRDYSKLPLLTPEEAYERATTDCPDRPCFGVEYRVRNLEAWKAIETMLRQDDIAEITVASFGLRRFSDSLDAMHMLRNRGWQTHQISLRAQVDGRLTEIMALKATHRGS